MEEDDDFGGFEAAEPVAPQEAQPLPPSLQASPSPWAVFPGGFPSQVEASSLSETRSVPQTRESVVSQSQLPSTHATMDGASNGIQHQPTGLLDDCFDADFNVDFSVTGVVIPKFNPQTTGINDARNDSFPKNAPDPDVDLDLDLELEQLGSTDILAANTKTTSQVSSVSQSSTALPLAPTSSEVAPSSNHVSIPKSDGDSPSRSRMYTGETSSGEIDSLLKAKEVERDAMTLHAQQEKDNVQKELQELLTRHGELEEVLSGCKLKLKEQRDMYQAMQEKHAKQVEDLRKAGHSTLSVIVEEYKELVKTAVFEQQEVFHKKLQEAVKEEHEKCQELLKLQEHDFVKKLQEERSLLENRIQKGITDATEEQKLTLAEALNAEKERYGEEVKTLVQVERDASQKAVETAVQEERERSRAFVAEEKEKLAGAVLEERDKCRKATQQAIEEERSKCQDCIQTALAEERQKSGRLKKEALEESRTEMQAYIQEQKQNDSSVRRKTLASMDLFLEGARSQLQLLME